MSTRDETRRELKDLARLAAAMPKEHPSVPPPASGQASSGLSPSRITVPPAVGSARTPPPLPSRPPPSFGSARSSVPPPFRSVPPAPNALLLAAPTTGSRWRGLRAVAAGVTLAGAMVGGLLLGQALASHPATASTTHPVARVAVAGAPQISSATVSAATATATPPLSVAAPTPMPTEAAAAAPPAIVITDTSSSTVMVRAPRPAHHAEPRPAPKPVIASASAPVSSAASAKASLGAKAPPSRLPAHDSLDDLIRKAAASN